MRTTTSLLSVCALAASVAAQTNVAVTITNGAASYTQSGLPTNDTSIPFADVLNGGGGDVLYQHWFFFRVGADPREYTFKDDGTATRIVNGSGTGMTTMWTDVDNRGQFSATLTQDLFPSGAQGGFLIETLGITNLGNLPLGIDIFAYSDFDVAGPGGDSARGDLSSQVIVDGANMMLAGEFLGVNNDAVEVGPWASIRNKLTNNTVDNLAGWNGSFGPADYTGAYQWSLVVPGNGSFGVICQLVTMDCRPDSTNYGTGGTGTAGIPTIWSHYPVMRASPSPTPIRVEMAAPSSFAALLLNLNSAQVTLFGINVLVDPNGVSTLFAPTTPSGTANFALQLPAQNPAFCGVSFFGQVLVADSLAANGLASATNGLQLDLGGW